MTLAELLERELGPHARELASAFRVAHAPEGAVVLEQGASGGGLVAVLDGSVRVEVPAPAGGFGVRRVVGPGELLGLLASIDQGLRSARCAAASEVLVATLDGRDFERWYAGSDAASLAFLEWLGRQLAGDLRQLTEVLVDAARG